MAVVFEGRKLAEKKLARLGLEVAILKKRLGRPPRLKVLMVGENKASRIYVEEKKAAAKRVGIDFDFFHFPSSAETGEVLQYIKVANKDEKIDGLMVQLPIKIKNQSASWRTKIKILNAIRPDKDVDCLTEENLGLVKKGKPRFLPATVKAVLEIIDQSGKKEAFLRYVVVGNRGFVGRPLAWALKNKGFEVLGIDLETKNIGRVARQADILISCTGRPDLIKKEMVKKGAALIDVGYPRGDVDFEAVKEKASFITPVPGGLGPVTVASLLENLVLAWEKRLG